MMCGHRKEWEDQYNVDVGGTPTNLDALLEKFETYKKINKSKLQSTPIPRKPAAGLGGNPISKKRSGGGRGDGGCNKKTQRPGWSEKFCKCCKEWVGPQTIHNTKECKKYNKRGERVAHAGGNKSEQSGGNSPPGKTWAKERRSFMTSMKAMEKTVSKLAKKVSKKGDRKKTSCKRDCYESDSSNSDSK